MPRAAKRRKRRKAPKRRRAAIRRFARRATKRPLGISAKIGLLIAGVAPPALSGVMGFQRARTVPDAFNVGMEGKIVVGVLAFVNEFTSSFGMGSPFPYASIRNKTGTQFNYAVKAELPAGWAWPVAGAGMVAVIYDRVAGWLSGRKGGVRAFGVTAIGGK